jgi:hypothetical protein
MENTKERNRKGIKEMAERSSTKRVDYLSSRKGDVTLLLSIVGHRDE